MTHNQTYNWRAFCKESLDQVENYQQALAEDFAGWCIHHRLEIQPDGTRVSRQQLIDQDLYYGRPASELVFMRNSEHLSLHNTGNTYMKGKHLSEETRQKLSESHSGEKNPFFGKNHSEETLKRISEALKGKHHSEDTRLKMSESHKGKHLTAEHRQKISEANKGNHHSAETCKKLSEAFCGMLYWNNGISNKRCRECPGEGWKRGRLKASMTSCKT